LLHERLRPWQWTAVAVASCAVVVLTVDLGRPPWIALVLAFSFATYGLMKNQVRMPALESLGVETALLAVPAALVLAHLKASGQLVFGGPQVHVTVLLVSVGAVTAVPLLLFAAAASRIPLSTMGLLQYVTPTLQFVIGLWVVHETMSAGRWVGFVMVWLALAVFSVDSLRAARARASVPALS
jgi:chloramphenicol-sensitive protein RarD